MTITRILAAAAAAVALVLGSAPAGAQGRSPQQVVISPTVVRSLTARKQKSKISLSARARMRAAPATTVVTSESGHSATTSVRAIRKTIPGAR